MKRILVVLAFFCMLLMSPVVTTAQASPEKEDRSQATTVSGKVLTNRGKVLKNATVILTDTEGNRRQVVSDKLGLFAFRQVRTGETYVLGVSAKRYRFSSRVVNVTGRLSGVVFTAID